MLAVHGSAISLDTFKMHPTTNPILCCIKQSKISYINKQKMIFKHQYILIRPCFVLQYNYAKDTPLGVFVFKD